jgi:hypothetical protein
LNNEMLSKLGVSDQVGVRKNDLANKLFSPIRSQISSEMALSQRLAAAFSTGLVQSAQIGIEPGLDTHDSTARQLETQTGAWEEVAKIFKEFKKAGLFDKTLFMVVTDFSRAPTRNSNGGKEHNPGTTSVLLAGGLVNGEQTVGASVITPDGQPPAHGAAHFDFRAGSPALTLEEARQRKLSRPIRPIDLRATVMALLGVSQRSDPATGAILRTLLKS